MDIIEIVKGEQEKITLSTPQKRVTQKTQTPLFQEPLTKSNHRPTDYKSLLISFLFLLFLIYFCLLGCFYGVFWIFALHHLFDYLEKCM